MTRVHNIRYHPQPWPSSWGYIGRANVAHGLEQSPWANPFIIGADGTRGEVLDRFDKWARINTQDQRAIWIREHILELPAVCVCWCADTTAGVTVADRRICHGQILAKMKAEALAAGGGRRDLLAELLGSECRCGEWKQPSQTLCRRCYRELPVPMRNALYRLFGEGYEEAYAAAATYLDSRKEVSV